MLLIINSGTLSKSHFDDAGFDIHSNVDMTIPPFSNDSVSTGLNITLPPNSLAFGKPRSGTSFGASIETGAGVIDNGYSGEVKIKLYNHGPNPFSIKKDQRIAQLVILIRPDIEVETKDQAVYNPPKDQPRNEKGFGSTGQH